jgi:hypothetical protein
MKGKKLDDLKENLRSLKRGNLVSRDIYSDYLFLIQDATTTDQFKQLDRDFSEIRLFRYRPFHP